MTILSLESQLARARKRVWCKKYQTIGLTHLFALFEIHQSFCRRRNFLSSLHPQELLVISEDIFWLSHLAGRLLLTSSKGNHQLPWPPYVRTAKVGKLWNTEEPSSSLDFAVPPRPDSYSLCLSVTLHCPSHGVQCRSFLAPSLLRTYPVLVMGNLCQGPFGCFIASFTENTKLSTYKLACYRSDDLPTASLAGPEHLLSCAWKPVSSHLTLPSPSPRVHTLD